MQQSHLDMILAATGGSLFVLLPEVAKLTGWSVKTMRNRPQGFPIPFSRIGKRVGIPAVSLAAYLDVLAGIQPAASTPAIEPIQSDNGDQAKRRQRGRPRKVSSSIGM